MNPKPTNAVKGARCTYPRGAMEILIVIQTTEPLTGAARTESEEPLPFQGWLELLHVLSRLIEAEMGAAGEKPAASSDRPTKEGESNEHTENSDVNEGSHQA